MRASCCLLCGVYGLWLATDAHANGWQARGTQAAPTTTLTSPARSTASAPSMSKATATATDAPLRWRPVRHRAERIETSYRRPIRRGDSEFPAREFRSVQYNESFGDSATQELLPATDERFARRTVQGRIYSSSNQRTPGPLDRTNPFRDDDDDGSDLQGLSTNSEEDDLPLTPLQLPQNGAVVDEGTSLGPQDSPIVIDCDLPHKYLYEIDLDITVSGIAGSDYPQFCALQHDEPYPLRYWPETVFEWKAASTCHKPLYFEEENLERYGHEFGPIWQPVYSGAHFFKSVVTLPYSMGLKTPNECVYTLGHYRPGNCAPKLFHATPFTKRAALFQGAFVGALIPIIP